MKQTNIRLAAALIAAMGVSAAAVADEIRGPYVQGDIGLANLKVDGGEKFKLRNTFRSLKNSYKDSGFMPRISAGYDFGDFRVAGDYTHYKSISEGVREDNSSLDVKVKARGVGVSAIYDIPLQSNFQPYVGARVAVNKVKAEATATVANARGHSSESETKVGYGLMAGLGYKINNNLTIDGGYRYNRLDSDLKAHEVSAGLRYTFN